MSSRTGLSRILSAAVLAIAALALSIFAFSGTARAAEPPPTRDITAFCAGTGSDAPFTDVGPGPHRETVLCLAALGVTTGTTPTTYSPGDAVRRDQMASFIARAVDAANRLETGGTDLADLPAAAADDAPFADVDPGNVHRSAIARLASAGIVSGVGEGRFDPAGVVTRAQMATFINQAEELLAGEAFSSADDFFADDAGDVHEGSINGIAAAGIASGKAAGTYGPGDPVTREQMASFIIRWLAHHEAEGHITPVAPTDGGPDLLGIEVTDADDSGTLTEGDPIELTYAAPVVVSSSITLTDESGTTVTLTDDVPTPPGATPATFTLSADGRKLTVVPTAPIVFNGGDSLEGAIDVTGASGIADAESGEGWRPASEPVEEVRFEFEPEAPAPGPGPGGPGTTVPAPTAPSITEVDPDVGPVTGGTTVTITGARFSGATSVTFGGVPATGVTVVSATEITAVTPAGSGTVAVAVTTPAGTDTEAGAFTYVAAPSVLAVSPSSGPVAGGNTVTITGDGFTGATAVAFGATPATSFTVVSDDEITAVVPAGVAGPVSVSVTTPGGTDTAPDDYAYVVAPLVTSVSPTSGPAAGGTTVTITGAGFTGATAVDFGGEAASFTVVSDTTITATTPAGSGTVDVEVTTAGGTAAASIPFTYVAAPSITSVAPAAGSELGGETVTITGTGLFMTSDVSFGGNPATFSIVSDTEITATAPAGTPGTVDVSVTAAGGTDTLEDAYTYVALTTVTSVSPTSGPEAGGNTVTIAGTGFTLASSVSFGGADAADFDVVSDTEISAVVPLGTGVVSVTVLSPGGMATGGSYTYVPAPTVSSVTPSSGPAGGGTAVTITGVGFTGLTSVAFGGEPAIGATVVNDTTITATTPAGTGTVDVVVTTAAGGAGTLEDGFTYVAAPEVSAVSPEAGPEAGGNTVTITGTGFTSTTAVTFDGEPVSFTVLSDTEISAVAPAGTGTADVVVTTTGGAGTLAGAYTYFPAPMIMVVTPNQGGEAGGNAVTIVGAGFTPGTEVTIDGAAAIVTAVSPSVVTATVPAGEPGTVDVVVTTPGGSATAPDAYTYLAAPDVGSVAPSSGPAAGGTEVVLTGTGFIGATGVTFGATTASFVVDSDSQITATAPAGTGTVDLVVTAPGGSVTVTDGFAYIEAPEVGSVEPSSGPEAGGTAVTVTGTGFTDATDVQFGSAPATSFTIEGDTQITAVSPAGTGVADVSVTTPGGTDTVEGAFSYIPAPTADDGVSPSAGPVAGGTTVTIAGSGFSGTTDVTVGGSAATFTVLGDGELEVVVPAGSAGPADVVITTPGGSVTISGGYTYVEAPEGTSVSPTSGSSSGGDTVTITGTGFATTTGVTFGGTEAASFTVDSDTQITAVTPVGPAGAADVVVTTAGGSTTLAGAFTFVDPPSSDDGELSPSSGPESGGTEVTITGSGFTGATAVAFGGAPATSFTVVSDTTVTAVAPAGEGTVDVSVTTVGGTATFGAAFSYIPAPSVGELSSTAGPATGGNEITIVGSGFTGSTGVTFAGTPAADFTVLSDTEITVVVPAGTPGTVDVVVTAPGGSTTVEGGYTYVGAPAVTAVAPGAGPEEGGNAVTITGSGFTGATSVTFDGVPAAAFTVNSDGQISATVPAGAAGDVDVVVTTVGGTGTGTYTYVEAPDVLSIDPTSGPPAGGTVVTITGNRLTGTGAVYFGAVPATSFTVDSDSQVTAVAPPGSGTVSVAVVTPGGLGFLPAAYSYVTAPVVTSATPPSGPVTGGNTVTIAGTGFTAATAVYFGPTPAAGFTVNSDTEITAVAPARPAGAVNVVVITPGGLGSAPAAYTYAPAPAITSVAPTSGPETGGTSVTLTGSGFIGATSVTFDGAPASLDAIAGASITVTAPAGTGTADIVVTAPGGTATAADAYTYVPAPTITTISPDTGPTSGGDTVTITGSGLAGVTEVGFGGASSTPSSATDTELTVVVPAGAPGAADVTVTSVGGTATAVGGYTYAPVPEIVGISPSIGAPAGGNTVTITGSALQGTTAVLFGATPATGVIVVNPTQVTATVPPGALGAADVTLVTPGGSATVVEGYTYSDAPTITFLSPDVASQGDEVVINGTNLGGTVSVQFNGAFAGLVSVAPDGTSVTVTVPPGSGIADVAVSTNDGFVTAPNAFQYDIGV